MLLTSVTIEFKHRLLKISCICRSSLFYVTSNNIFGDLCCLRITDDLSQSSVDLRISDAPASFHRDNNTLSEQIVLLSFRTICFCLCGSSA